MPPPALSPFHPSLNKRFQTPRSAWRRGSAGSSTSCRSRPSRAETSCSEQSVRTRRAGARGAADPEEGDRLLTRSRGPSPAPANPAPCTDAQRPARGDGGEPSPQNGVCSGVFGGGSRGLPAGLLRAFPGLTPAVHVFWGEGVGSGRRASLRRGSPGGPVFTRCPECLCRGVLPPVCTHLRPPWSHRGSHPSHPLWLCRRSGLPWSCRRSHPPWSPPCEQGCPKFL